MPFYILIYIGTLLYIIYTPQGHDSTLGVPHLKSKLSIWYNSTSELGHLNNELHWNLISFLKIPIMQ